MATKFAFERREGESGKAFAALEVYLKLGSERSLLAVSRKMGKGIALMCRWSARWDWTARAAAYDDRMATVDREMQEIAVRAKSPVWAKRQEEQREKAWSLHHQLIKAAELVLADCIAKQGVGGTLSDAARLLEVATKLGCMASGLPMERVAVTGGDGGPVKVEFLAALDRAYGDKPAGEVVDVEIAPAAVAALAPGAT